MIEVLAPLGIGFGLAAALTPLFLRMARGSGIVAYPAADRWHRRQVPLLGGAAVYSAFLIALFLIAIVLVVQFNSILVPAIIMCSVVLSLIGVFLGFARE